MMNHPIKNLYDSRDIDTIMLVITNKYASIMKREKRIF